jgi:hypothetical protein
MNGVGSVCANTKPVIMKLAMLMDVQAYNLLFHIMGKLEVIRHQQIWMVQHPFTTRSIIKTHV